MHLSKAGVIVQQEWGKSFEIRAELFCDAFVIMPNHIQGIVRIDGHESHDGHHGPKPPNDSDSMPETRADAPMTKTPGAAHRAPKSISSFIAGFKSSATKKINAWRNRPGSPVWQSRFHDHIIRNEDDYFHIKHYIQTNPSN